MKGHLAESSNQLPKKTDTFQLSQVPEQQVDVLSRVEIQNEVQKTVHQLAVTLQGKSKKTSKSSRVITESAEDYIEATGCISLPKPPNLTQEIAQTFIDACGGSLREKDTKVYSINVKGIVYGDTPRIVLRGIGRLVFGNKSAVTKSVRYLTEIADGKSHNDALAASHDAVGKRKKAELLPNPPSFTKEMAKAVLLACDLSSEEVRIFDIQGTKFTDSVRGVKRRIGWSLWRDNGALKKADCYINHIASGKTHQRAKEMADQEATSTRREGNNENRVPMNITSDIARGIIDAAGGHLNSKDTEYRLIQVGDIQYKDQIRSLLQRISNNLFGSSFKYALSIQYLQLLYDGFELEEAKRQVISMMDKQTTELSSIPVSSHLTCEIAKAFLSACNSQLSGSDREIYKFQVGGIKFADSPHNLLRRISLHIFGVRSKHTKANQFFREIAAGKSYVDALAALGEIVPMFPAPPNLTQDIVKVFMAVCGGRIDVGDDGERQIVVDGRRYGGSPQGLIRKVNYHVFQNRDSAKAVRYIKYIGEGKIHEEAKELSEREENSDLENNFEKIDHLNIAEAISLFRDDSQMLKRYLQFAYKELTEDEIDELIITSFRGMRMGGLEKSEEKYLQWNADLPSMSISEELPEATTESTIVVSGTVTPETTHIFIAGNYTRIKQVDESGKFSLTIPLHIGQTNDFRLMSLDRKGKKRSEQDFFTVKQKGKPDDVAALVELLSKLKDMTIAEVQQNPGRFQHLCRCMEQSLIKRFGRSFADGERYVHELIERETTAPAMRKVLRSVLAKFKQIHQAEIPGTIPGSLLFFQKYCAVDIRRRIEEQLPGVFLANAPGTGKTRIIQAATADMDTTVITPNSVVSAWDEESGKVLENADVLALRGVSHAVRKEQLRTRKRLRATLGTPHHTYINREFLQRVDDPERFKLLSDKETVVVHDEGHSRANEQSLQSKGASMLDSQFQILVSATPFKNPRTFRRMMAILRPKDKRFSSDAAFSKAFPADDPQALRTLSLLKQDVTLRFREEDVFETVDPKQSLSQQRHKLPSKEFIDPEKIGSFEMSEDQAESIYQMFVNWNRWCKTNNKYIPKDKTAKEDHLRVGDGFAKRHALRQTVNNPSYINSKVPDHKLIEAKKIIAQCIKEGRKVVVFCAYEAQAQKYAEAFSELNPALYTGETSALGDAKDANSKPIKFRKGESEDDHHAWVLDSSGRPIPDPNGQTMSALDYERITFQNIADRKLLIATYSAGSVGSTFTAGNAMIFDDLPSDCVEAIQAEGRIRRIDPNRLTYAMKKYYTLQSKYPASFMERVSKRWLVKQEHHYKEFDSRETARKYAEKRGLKYVNAAEEFFDQGTYDEVHGRNLKVQRTMFNLINDGIADESILGEDQEMFKGLANGKK